MLRNILLACSLLLCLTSTLHAGIDEEFGERTSWWKASQNEFLSLFGIQKNYALVIGISEYKGGAFQSLPSEKDAVRMKDYLINEAGFDHVRLITGDQVNVAKIRKLMLDDYPNLLGSKDRFLFYWSGHGVTTDDARKQGYLAVQNSQSTMVSSMLSMQDLSQWDRRMKAKQTLYLLDACFSGMAASKAMSVTQSQTIERVSQPSSQVLTAGLDDQQTIAISDINGGVFTRALLDGLRGHADTDKGPFKKDGVVTARELEIYVRARVDHERRRVGWDKPITPVLYNFSRHEGDFFFVHNKGMLKKPSKLKQENKSKIVATGVTVQSRKPTETNLQTTQRSRFHDNGDGTITDNIHGLIWKKCSEGQHGNKCQGESVRLTWKKAMEYAKNHSFANSNEWRLPNIKELSSLVYCSNKEGFTPRLWNGGTIDDCGEYGTFQQPTIDLDIFKNTPIKFSGWWSSTKRSDTTAYGVSFYRGAAMYDGHDNPDRVRLVRTLKPNVLKQGNKEKPTTAGMKAHQKDIIAKQDEIYLDNHDGTITDSKTGLLWKKCSEGLTGTNCSQGNATKYNFKDALAHSVKQTFAGYSDWRLPTRNEILSLVYCTSNTIPKQVRGISCHDNLDDYLTPTINHTLFPNTAAWSYWSSTEHSEYPNSRWGGFFSRGGEDLYFEGDLLYLRLVRSTR